MSAKLVLVAASLGVFAGCGGSDEGAAVAGAGNDQGNAAAGGVAPGSTLGGAAQAADSIEDASPECRSYRGYTGALAKATIDCLGTVTPFLYGVNEKGLLERRFDACSTGGTNPLESPGLLRIDRLLSIQLRQATLPNVLKCIPQAYVRAQRAFVEQGNSTCPAWQHESTQGLPTQQNVRQSVASLPRLPAGRVTHPTALRTESFHFYSVSYGKESPQQPCGSAESCARACTAVFAGFYVGMSDQQIIGDPYWWLDPTDYGGFDPINDPYNRVNGFYHPMSLAGDDVPGYIYGDFARAAFADPNTNDVDYAAEECTRWDGSNHVMGRLIQDMLLPDDPTTWMSRCDFYPQGGIQF